MSPATVNGRPDTGCIAPAARLPLTSLCPFRRSRDDIPDELRGYYAQRHTIFSRYDSGIRLTDAAWYGVTPEAVAQEIAQDMKNSDPCKRFLIDAFAGAGGNVIAFALSGRWHHVIAIERDPHTLACAQHNANIYGVDDSMVSWVLGDSFDFIDALVNHPAKLHPDLRVDVNATVVFSSPPWGGPSYQNDRVFDLHRMEPYGLDKLHEAYITMDHAIYLPRTSDVRQIADLVPNNQRIRVVHYCIRKASKAMVAYLPAQKAQQTRTVPPPTSSAVVHALASLDSSPSTPCQSHNSWPAKKTFASVARTSLKSSPVQASTSPAAPSSISGQRSHANSPSRRGVVLLKRASSLTPPSTPTSTPKQRARFNLSTKSWVTPGFSSPAPPCSTSSPGQTTERKEETVVEMET